MKTIDDVRRALYAAYKEAHQEPDISWKSEDGSVDVHYPSYMDWPGANDEETFLLPDYIVIWSDLLGPRRIHHIYRAAVVDRSKNDSWRGPDVFALAVEMIEGWMVEFRADIGK